MKHPNELDGQLDNLRTLQQSYDAIAEAAEAYNTGKVELAQNITAKGVQASATETLPQLAAKVSDIQQRTIDITAPNWYGGQIGADGSLWDLYAVLAEMKNQWLGADHYKALIVCEYYKGYDSLQLQGADAYYTCDGDFYDTSSPLHVWHDIENNKMNRWVCFLFASEGARLDITNTSISPRSMYIGGHIGTIEYFVDGRLTELVCGVEETDVVDYFKQNGYSQSFNRKTILRNVTVKKGCVINGAVFVDAATDETSFSSGDTYGCAISGDFQYAKIKSKNTFTGGYAGAVVKATNYNVVGIEIDGDIQLTGYSGIVNTLNPNIAFYLTYLHAKGYTGGENNTLPIRSNYVKGLNDLWVGQVNTNINMSNWIPDYLSDADKKAKLIDNIKNHILACVSDATGGTQLVFTVSKNMYNNIASEQIEWQGETMSLADAFLTKNWLLAGA